MNDLQSLAELLRKREEQQALVASQVDGQMRQNALICLYVFRCIAEDIELLLKRSSDAPESIAREVTVRSELPMCGVPGCNLTADPRWYMHRWDGEPIMTCDGHGMICDGSPCICPKWWDGKDEA